MGSSTVTVVEFTVVVVPPTIRFPAMLTVVLLAPMVRVLGPIVSNIVLLPTVKSKSVRAVRAVIVPPKEVDVPPMVIALLASLAFAMLPAN